MDWGAIGAMGELAGSLATLGTLGYLAVQIRHARQEIARATKESQRSTGNALIMATRLSNERVAQAKVKVAQALDTPKPPFVTELMHRAGIDEADALALYWEQFIWWQHTCNNVRNLDVYTHAEGSALASRYRRLYSYRTEGALWFDLGRDALEESDPDVVRYVDALRARSN